MHDVFVLLSPIFLSLYMAIKAYKGEPKTYTVSDSVLKLYMYFCLHSQSDGIQTIYIFALIFEDFVVMLGNTPTLHVLKFGCGFLLNHSYKKVLV